MAKIRLLGSFYFLLFLFSAGTALSQPSASRPKPSACSQRADEYLSGRLAVWQERLQLQNWRISIVFSHPGDLRPNSLGNIRWDAERKSAVIRVLDPADYQWACLEMFADMEFTVVHELIHLALSSLPRNEANRGSEESAVNRIAQALLTLDRRQQAPLSKR